MAYFDNAATTYPKPNQVYDFMNEFYRIGGGNAGRGNYGLAAKAGNIIKETRSLIKELLHCPAKEVIFTPTATLALNVVIQGLIKKGVCTVYISPFEHNSVTRILHHYEKENLIKVVMLQVDRNCGYNLEKIRYQFQEVKPEMIIVSHASNVTGYISPVEDIFAIGKEYDAITVLDMSQSAGLVDVNIGLNIFDFAIFDGHKTMYGPTGIAGFVMNQDIHLEPIIFGGTGFDSANQDMPDSIPERYEMGSSNIVSMSGLYAALKWLKEETIEKLYAIEMQHREQLLEILGSYDFLKIVGADLKGSYVGIVTCLINGISSDSAATIFNERNIAVRTGLHCAPLAHKYLGTFPAGTIRFSVGYFTSEKDFDELREALDDIEDNL